MDAYKNILTTNTAGTVNADFQLLWETSDFSQVSIRIVNNGDAALTLKLQEADYPTAGDYFDVIDPLTGEALTIVTPVGASYEHQLKDMMNRKSYRLTGTLGTGSSNSTVSVLARTND